MNPEHLTYFANVYFDIDQMVNDYSLNLSKEMLFTSCGDTVVEAVYKNGSHVGTAKMYTVQGSSKPTGAVYKVYLIDTPAVSLNDNLIRTTCFKSWLHCQNSIETQVIITRDT